MNVHSSLDGEKIQILTSMKCHLILTVIACDSSILLLNGEETIKEVNSLVQNYRVCVFACACVCVCVCVCIHINLYVI